MKSRRFIISVLAIICIFILGWRGFEESVYAIASVALGIAGAGAVDTYSEKRFENKEKKDDEKEE